MADERDSLLEYHAEQRERTSQLLDHEIIVRAQEQADYPVDHGRLAWMQVLGGFIVFANSWGLSNAFSVLQVYYMDGQRPEEAASRMAWIGTMQLFFTGIGCLPGGMFLDRGYLKSLIAVGTVLEVVGLILASSYNTYWSIFFARGLCVGFGSGLLAVIPFAVIATFFEKRKMLATGIASTGASIAGIVYTLALHFLVSSVGYSLGVCIFTLVILVTNTVAFVVMRLQPQHVLKGLHLSFQHFKNLPYALFVVAFALLGASSVVPFFYIHGYAVVLGVSKDLAFALLIVMYAANMLGRIVPNLIADRYGGINTLLPLNIVCIITMCMMRLASSLNTLLGIGIVYGFFSGGLFSLPGAIITGLSPNRDQLGIRLGLAHFFAAFGGLLGAFAVGAVKSQDHGAVESYNSVWWCIAAIMSAGAVTLTIMRWITLGSPWAVGRM